MPPTSRNASATAGGDAPPPGPHARVMRIAHRGFSHVAPENTLAAIEAALAAGTDGVEFDVHRTADGALVLLHDDTVERTTDFLRLYQDGRSSAVRNLTLAELELLDAGAWKADRYRGERIPTLRQALAALRGKATPVIEIKAPDIGRQVAELVIEMGLEDEVFVQSFNAGTVADFNAACRAAASGFLAGKPDPPQEPVALAGLHARTALAAGANAVVVHHAVVAPEYLQALHARALSVWTWTVNDPQDMRRLASQGIDGIITDRSDLLNAVLDMSR